MHKLIFTFLLCIICNLSSNAQSGGTNPAKRPPDWWQADWKKDSLPGISLDQAYEYLKGRKSKTVIVAILDDCIDTAHEDLKGILWTNKKEIPGNGIDDDKNGYTDDVHGWCFVCGRTGISQNKESSGNVLTYITWRKKFEHIDTNKLAGILKIQYEMYQKAKDNLFATYHLQQVARTVVADTVKFIKYLDNLSGRYSDSTMDKIPFATLPFLNPYDSSENIFWSIFMERIMNPNPPPLKIWISILKSPDYPSSQFFKEVGINDDTSDTLKNFRAVVGDDDDDFNEKYGAPNIKPLGHSDQHATLIAGIIAANRKNDIGIKGIADNVLIMPVIIGNNQERDKDIVFAIHYAVDNGASIINLSIGGVPEIEEHEKELREVFDYASQKGVLVVNAAGNDFANLDNEKYQLGQGTDGNSRDEYIRVGATTSALNENLVSTFSCYGEQSVDLFAPGTAIYSTVPGNKYDYHNGTSYSCPIVVGVAALLKSYFPRLTAKQLKEILVKSVYKPTIMVIDPGNPSRHKIPFGKMSKSGGIVNAYNAVKLADEMTKKETQP